MPTKKTTRRPVTLLDEALALWRDHPAPEIASLVVRAATTSDPREPISGLDHAERHASWLAIEKQRAPADFDRLLATLVEGRCEQAIERMTALLRWPHDPRLLAHLVAYAEADPRQRRGDASPMPFTSGPNRAFWVALIKVIDERGDASLVSRFTAIAARETLTNFERWLATKLTKSAAKLAKRPVPTVSPEITADLATRIARVEAAHKPTADTGDALYAAVWAAPDDDAPRVVLADFLSERGDPRGELITLQLARAAGTLDRAGKAREKELLKRHKKIWLGPIVNLVQSHALRFERGFLCTCFLEPNAKLEATLGSHPAWSTIREFYYHAYARETAKPLAAMLVKRGAVLNVTAKFTRGIE